jgi:hypothetical protein
MLLDPTNDVLIEQAFLMELTEGKFESGGAGRQACRVGQSEPMTQLFLGLVDFKAKRWADADVHFKAAGSGPIGRHQRAGAGLDVAGANETDKALQLIEVTKQAEWAQFYMLSSRLIAVGGRRQRPGYEKIFKTDNARRARRGLRSACGKFE